MQTAFDDRWRELAVAGDAQAIARLAHSVLTPLYRFCYYRVGGDHYLCEEAVQQSLLAAIQRIEQYEPQRSGNDIFGWLTGLARNEIQRLLAGRQRTTSLDALWTSIDRELVEAFSRIDGKDLREDVLERDETRQMVNAAMSQLPTTYREALEAKYVEGHSVREMAESWSTTEKAVESRLTRARQAFRDTFLALNHNLDQSAIL